MTFPYKFFKFPFAVAGDAVTSPPNTVQGDGSVSYPAGYGPDYSLDPATNPSAIDIERADMNGVFNDITTAQQYVQTGLAAAWIDNATNGGSAFSYAKNAVVLYTDGTVYWSQVANNTTVPGTDITKWVPFSVAGTLPGGACILAVASATSLSLSPRNGNVLNIAGVNQQIPAAGITIANSGLTASTLYYAYAYMNSGTMTLELSTTGHVVGPNGVETKNGDPTRTLVGMIFTSADTPGQFVDSTTQRFCANWYNRKQQYAFNAGARTSSLTSIFDVLPSNHAEFICWVDGAHLQSTVGTECDTAQSQVDIYIAFDTTTPAFGTSIESDSVGVNYNSSTPGFWAPLSEGYHYGSVYAASPGAGITIDVTVARVEVQINI